MCGVIGVILKEGQASYESYNAISGLQHRGQDTCGILSDDCGTVYINKKKGLVSNYSEEEIEGLLGTIAIAHTRYPTRYVNKDKGSILNAQPFYSSWGNIGLAHNGHIINCEEINEFLHKKRFKVFSSCDAEYILRLFSYYFQSNKGEIKERAFESVGNIMDSLKGSYSVVAVISGEGLLAFRDPHAIRPLVFGKLIKEGNVVGYIFSSETVAFERLGFEYVRDVYPGEAIFIDRDLNFSSKEICPGKKKHCFFEWEYFSRAPSIIEGRKVNSVRYELGRELALEYLSKEEKPELDFVTYVPETPLPTAKGFSNITGIDLKIAIEKNRYLGRNFIKPSEEKRQKDILNGLIPLKEIIDGKKIGVIDDSLVRGSTAINLVKIMRSYGAKEIHLFLATPHIRFPCNLGIDIPTKEELFSYNKEIEEIRRGIGVDSINFLSIDSVEKAIGLGDNLCMACIDGIYPVMENKTKNLLGYP